MDPVPTFDWVFEYQPLRRDINTAKSLQNSRKQIASRQKRSPTLDPDIYLDYLSILITFIEIIIVLLS